ncbi:MAG: TetR/AcrR family transcriptional regulator [Acidimicrobiales bacterium]|nr:TetR/AcrR family transcriptional regulator [Acidimicrobiales bacterium]
MPTDSTETRARLIDAAERLFAERGVWRVTTREITEAAEQKNTSAISYHFGGREGLMAEILRRHGDPIDLERAELLTGIDSASPSVAIIDALVRPMTARLADPSGRRYLRVVAQLTTQFADWRGNELVPEHVNRALDWLEQRPAAVPLAVRRVRVVSLIMLMSSSLAERARLLDTGGPVDLDPGDYEANLTDMLVGIIDAPVSVSS